jgi:GGDEF domain-containing protein
LRTVVAWLAMSALLWAAAVQAEDRVVTLEPQMGQVMLDGQAESWLDESGSGTIASVAGSAVPWSTARQGTVFPLRPGRALWVRVTVDVHDDSQRWYLEVPYPALDRISIYTPDAQGRWTERTAGDSVPVASWPVPHRHAALPLMLTPGEPQQFYVRIENQFSFSTPMMFTSERELLRQEQRMALVLGIYFGLAGLSIILALFGAVTVRDTAFGWYALTVSLLGLAQAALTGVAGLHLWPHSPRWGNLAAMVLSLAAVGALLCFLSVMVSLRERSTRLARAQEVLSVACAAAAVLVMFVDASWRLALVFGGVSAALAMGIGFVAWAARRGDRHAGWLLLGMLPVTAAGALPMARAAGLIPASFWTANAMLIGIALELPILLAVLAARVHDRRENIRRISGLERIDPATGLVNAHVFLERMGALIARSERLKHQSVVLLIDLVNVDHIRRTWDKRSAEELPLRLASRLLGSARDIDTVARLSDHRFGLLVEGPVPPGEAAATGAKVVAACLRPFDDKPVQWVPQVRIAQTVVPGLGDAQLVLDKLEAVLASAPADSRRAVFSVGMESVRA